MNNEITLKIKCDLKEFYKKLENQNFVIENKFLLDDTYFIPENLDIKNMSSREILSKAVLLRNLEEYMPNKKIYKLTFKKKEIDENGNILNQVNTSCEVVNLEKARAFIEAIGYKKLMRIIENDVVYVKDRLGIAVKDIENGENLIEVEIVDEDENLNTIEKLIKKLDEYDLPLYKDNYFVKKAEIELEKILDKN